MNKENGIPRIEWSPKVIVVDGNNGNTIKTLTDDDDDDSFSSSSYKIPSKFYMLPSNVVLIPFHSINGENPGHLVWDDFLPIYNLLHLFELNGNSNNNNNNMEPLMLRYVLDSGKVRGLWASCDWNKEKRKTCNIMHNKFLPLMTTRHGNQSKLTTTVLSEFNITTSTTTTVSKRSTVKEEAEQQQQQPPQQQKQANNNNNNNNTSAGNLICARHGVAGLGSLTDHGTVKLHGWEDNDYKITHNHGRSWLFWEFRQFAMKNLGILNNNKDYRNDIQSDILRQRPLKIIFSLSSSSRSNRNIKFTQEIAKLKQTFATDGINDVIIESYKFKDYTLKEQVQIANDASIFVSGCGGGAVTSIFVPKGASIILYYASNGGVRQNKMTGLPARLDWDLFNNLGYARVHWLDRVTMSRNEDLNNFVELIKHELNVIRYEYPPTT